MLLATTVMVGLLSVAHIIDTRAAYWPERLCRRTTFRHGRATQTRIDGSKRRKGEVDNDQTEFLRNELCACLSDVRKESREQRSDEGGSGRNNPLAYRAYGKSLQKAIDA